MDKYYTLVNAFSNCAIGRWLTYEAAENYRNTLDDWMYWDIDIIS